MKPPRGKLAEPSDVSCRGGWSPASPRGGPRRRGRPPWRGAGRVPNPGRSPPSPAPGRLVSAPATGRWPAGQRARGVRERPRVPWSTAGDGGRARSALTGGARAGPGPPEGVRRYSGTCPTRLETRTKESDACASRRVSTKPHGEVKARGPSAGRGRDLRRRGASPRGARLPGAHRRPGGGRVDGPVGA